MWTQWWMDGSEMCEKDISHPGTERSLSSSKRLIPWQGNVLLHPNGFLIRGPGADSFSCVSILFFSGYIYPWILWSVFVIFLWYISLWTHIKSIPSFLKCIWNTFPSFFPSLAHFHLFRLLAVFCFVFILFSSSKLAILFPLALSCSPTTLFSWL